MIKMLDYTNPIIKKAIFFQYMHNVYLKEVISYFKGNKETIEDRKNNVILSEDGEINKEVFTMEVKGPGILLSFDGKHNDIWYATTEVTISLVKFYNEVNLFEYITSPTVAGVELLWLLLNDFTNYATKEITLPPRGDINKLEKPDKLIKLIESDRMYLSRALAGLIKDNTKEEKLIIDVQLYTTDYPNLDVDCATILKSGIICVNLENVYARNILNLVEKSLEKKYGRSFIVN